MTLKIKTEKREDHQMKIVAEFAAVELDKYKRGAARKIADKAKIPGFRPGKAPYDVISRLYGEPAIEEEAIEIMVEKVYPEILTEAKIEPAAPGTLEDIKKGDPIILTFIVPLEPTVDLGDYKTLRKKYSLKPATQKEIDEFLAHMQKTYATAEPVERAAENGDLVYLKLNAVLEKPEDGENSELLKDSPLQLVIGENDSERNDFPYPGFGDNLIGLKASDEKNVKYKYPKDSKFDKLQGKDVEFHVKVEQVKSLHLPELNDDFAKTLGEFDSFEKLKETVKNQLEDRHRVEYEQTYFDELIDKLIEKAKVAYPPQVLEHEVEHTIEHVKEDLAEQHMELDVYLKTLKKEKTIWLEEEIKPAAKKRLERSLVLDQLAKVEKIEVTSEDLKGEVTRTLAELQQSTDPKKLEKELKSSRVANAITMQSATRVLNRKVMDRLKDIATGKEIETPAVEESKVGPKSKVIKTNSEEKPAAKKASTGKKLSPAVEEPAEKKATATKKPTAKKAD
jgi:trigger factor